MRPLTRRVPLAWRNLIHHKLRFLVAVGGITFAVLLMFVQFGFRAALLESNTAFLRRLNGELVITHRGKYYLTIRQPFPRHRLQQAQPVTGVKAVYPVYLGRAAWKNPLGHVRDNSSHEDAPVSPGLSRTVLSRTVAGEESHIRPVRVVAINPDEPVLRIPECAVYAEALKQPNTALVDERARPFFQISANERDPAREISLQAIRIIGKFRLGTDFSFDGNMIMSADNFAHYFPGSIPEESPLALVELGVVQLQPGADREQVRARLEQAMPDDVHVVTLDELISQEEKFWLENTPIGQVFFLGVVMGVLVGVVICYQVLSADITDHLPEFATLKAMGYQNSYLTRVVLQEALLLSVLGFVPGIALSLFFYLLLGWQTGLPLHMTLLRSLFVLVLAVGMCILSGLIVIRKVQVADPAEVFR